MSDAHDQSSEDAPAPEPAKRRFWTRGRLVVAVTVLVIAGIIGWWRFDNTVLQDRRLHKDAAIAQCTDAIRGSISSSLRAAGTSDADSMAISAGARFSDVDGNPEPLSFDNHGVPTELGKKPSSVLTNWQISGRVSLDGSLSFGSGLGPNNRFGCSVIVFDDNTIHVASRQVERA